MALRCGRLWPPDGEEVEYHSYTLYISPEIICWWFKPLLSSSYVCYHLVILSLCHGFIVFRWDGLWFAWILTVLLLTVILTWICLPFGRKTAICFIFLFRFCNAKMSHNKQSTALFFQVFLPLPLYYILLQNGSSWSYWWSSLQPCGYQDRSN